MIAQNLHTHTIYDDGKDTPAGMAEGALAAGLASLGFSGHSVLPYENDWAMTADSQRAWRAAVADAKAAYEGRLEIFLGLEWDLLSDPREAEGCDYVIGAVHHIAVPSDTPLTVDESPDVTRDILGRYFGGDAAAMAEAYYAQYEALAELPFVDIAAHFDLLTKFDEKHSIFDGNAPRYRDAAIAAMERLVRADKIFEVNTGAMSRGWRSSPYPSAALLRELLARNGRVLVSADAHSADAVAYAFPEAESLLRQLGFRERWEYAPGGFVPVAL